MPSIIRKSRDGETTLHVSASGPRSHNIKFDGAFARWYLGKDENWQIVVSFIDLADMARAMGMKIVPLPSQPEHE